MVLTLSHTKMPHSNFKMRYNLLGSGVGKCPCSKTFDFTSGRDQEMKFWLHRKFCSKTVGFKQLMILKKAMTPREQQLNDAERKGRVQNHH